MTIASQIVYSTATSGFHGHIAHFEVETRSFRDTRIVIHLPEICQLFGEPGVWHVESKFYDVGYDLVDVHEGTASQELLDAAKVFIDNAIHAFDPRIGVRAVANEGRVALIGYLDREVVVEDLYEALGRAIFDDDVEVDVQPVSARSMGAREWREWQDHQLIDY
jgi:hypothetical protein